MFEKRIRKTKVLLFPAYEFWMLSYNLLLAPAVINTILEQKDKEQSVVIVVVDDLGNKFLAQR